MLQRTVEIGGLRVRVEVPERYVPASVRRGVQAVRRRPPTVPSVPDLTLAEVPPIGYERRDTELLRARP